ncbi:ubiquitin-like protein Mdy2p [[Candida] railenensis]|uniref:Ubiquitin-like protein Mdy2p n=1 Tax=[Candida] railenensis TaxID=45579 RepID=A0A9P0QL51_9ASCO|nr:ubiquitin-like protein Mdy2p [[Candida] railenensis]
MTEALVKPSFNSAYLELIGLSENAPSSAFYSTSDYSKLNTLGPSLPKSKVPIPRSGANDNSSSSSTLLLTFKSIKPPFKFSTQLSNVPDNYAVYKIKNDLIESLQLLKDAHVVASDLKLLVKGKVIQDTAILSTLVGPGATDISFMCMVSAPKSIPAEQSVGSPTNDNSDPTDASPNSMNDPTTILPATWKKIESILVEDLGKENATSALQKLQSAFN